MEPTLTVNGRTYDWVPMDEFTIGESIVLWNYTQLGMDEVADLEGFHPGVVAALIHVAMARTEPETPEKKIRAVVLALPIVELENIFEGISVEDETIPPPSAPVFETGPDRTSAYSGGDSLGHGAAQEDTGEQRSGDRGSDTRAISGPVT